MYVSARRPASSVARHRLAIAACSWMGIAAAGHAADEPAACELDAVAKHVREQIRLYGPQSQQREFFAFIYRFEGRVMSAVVRGNECRSKDRCTTDTSIAAKQIPKGARVLGEWHTHPQVNGSRGLSAEDVKGAHRNRGIRCYMPYYSTPDGEIYAWDASKTSVPTAMNSRVLVDGSANYLEPHHASGNATLQMTYTRP